MKLNRRKMFGVAAGGAIAAPSLVRSAGHTVGPAAAGLWDGARKDGIPVEDPNWTRNNLAKLKRLASGDIRDEDRTYPIEGPPEPFRALRSVSDEAKNFLRNRRCERQWQERTIKAALDALDEAPR